MTGELHNRKMKQNENKQNNKNQIIMKKHMILVAIATLTLASCAKIDTFETKPVLDENVPIGFTNYTPKSLTKANTTLVENSATLTAGQKFGVYSYKTANNTAFTSAAATSANAFMSGTVVTFQNNNNNGANNSYSPLRYWPSGDTPDWLTFWAYYPVTDATTTGTIDSPTNGITYTAPTGSNGVGSYSFTAAAAVENMVDFLVSDVANDKIYGTSAGDHIAVNGAVPLVFRHQLTKIRFAFKKEANVDANTTIKLLDAKLYNVKNSGTLTTSYNAANTPNVTTDWGTSQTGAATYDVKLNATDIAETTNEIPLSTTATAITNGTDAFLMVPQSFVTPTFDSTTGALTNAAQYLEVKWSVTTGTVTTINTKKLYFQKDVYNGDDPAASGYAALSSHTGWEKNAYVVYTVTIGPKPIRFTATVENWADPELNGYFNVN